MTNPREPTRHYDLEDRLIDFAALVYGVVERLPNTRVGRHVAGQLLRCGTAPASNYGEAQSAESRKDFNHKLHVCLKELRETVVWLRFALRIGIVERFATERAIAEADQLIAILYSSARTATRNARRGPLDEPSA